MGEYEAFLYILNSCSGVVQEKLCDLFAITVSRMELDQLATLIYYPKEKLEQLQAQIADLDEWRRITIHRLTEVCLLVSAKYSRSKVRAALPKECAYIIEERLHTHNGETETDGVQTPDPDRRFASTAGSL